MTSPQIDAADLASCDSEPIHIPGEIQPHGVLFALHPASLVIEQVAGDTSGLLGIDAKDLLGKPVAMAFGEEQVTRLLDIFHSHQSRRHLMSGLQVISSDTGRRVDATVHETDGVVVLELEPQASQQSDEPLATLDSMLCRIYETETVSDFCQAMTEAIRSVTGFDRVMVYRFEPDRSGVVEAEARGDRVESYLGLHYPAADIPVQAHALYIRNCIRLIPDALYIPAKLWPEINPTSGRPLDLSGTVLRGVSPIHLEYLGNMGVRASMSVSIIIEGALWGLIACHSLTPLFVSHSERMICEIFVERACFQLKSQLAALELSAALSANRSAALLVRRLSAESGILTGLEPYQEDLLAYLPAGGIALCFNGKIDLFGQTPSDGQVANIVQWLNTQPVGVLATDRLSTIMPQAREFSTVASGLLAMSLSTTPVSYVIWFRPEQERIVTWAGDPRKAISSDAQWPRLTPRRSFAAWHETVRRQSQRWSLEELAAAKSLRLGLLEVVLRQMDSMAHEREETRQRQTILMAELDHRVKNMLATIQAMVTQSEASADTLEEFLASFEGRLHAMSRAHDLLTRNRWDGADLKTLILEEIAPFASGTTPPTLVMQAGTVLLRAKATLALSLAIHELVTNAAKYGALSVCGGQVHVNWRAELRDGPVLVLSWREAGGPTVTEPDHEGFGRGLIESNLAHEIGGSVELTFPPEGVACTIFIPWDQIVPGIGLPQPVAAVAVAGSATLEKARVLLVEDNGMVASVMIRGLQTAKAVVIGPASRLSAAMELAEKADIDVAILDVDLDGTAVWPAADVLAGRGIPILFSTGYQAALIMPQRFEHCPVVNKPFRMRELQAALLRLLSKR